MFVEARIEHVHIQNPGLKPYIPETLHVILDRKRTDRTITSQIPRRLSREIPTGARVKDARLWIEQGE